MSISRFLSLSRIQYFIQSSFLIGLTSLTVGYCPFPAVSSLVGSVPLVGQEQPAWCWAGVGEMIMMYLGTDIYQCYQAGDVIGYPQWCCDNPYYCNFASYPHFSWYGFNYNQTYQSALNWDQIRDQIACKQRPIAFSWLYPGGGGHMMVAVGYRTYWYWNYVDIFNPLPTNMGEYQILYQSQYNTGPNNTYTHGDDYYNIGL